MAKIILKRNEDRRILNGHLWVFSNEIKSIDVTPDNGEIVEVYDNKNIFLGSGFYNRNSLIAVRLLDKSFDGNLQNYFKTKLLLALKLRKQIYPNRNSFRLVFSESDFLPGLIIDKYNNTYVLQVYCYGMQKSIIHIVDFLKDDFKAKNIFSRNENHFRKLEGLPEEDEIYSGEVCREIIDDGKIKYEIDFTNSQKTGFYFDQCDNREFIEILVKDKIVLDAFCNSGGFGLHAANAGAKSITFLDSSKKALEHVKNNFVLNNFISKKEYIITDVFEYLEECNLQEKRFDVIMIDPPPFAKNKKSLPQAMKGYEKLNKLALNIVTDGGYLVTTSCSHHLKEDIFLEIIKSAAIKAKKTLQQIHFNGASLDHPILPAMHETSYLKFAAFRVF